MHAVELIDVTKTFGTATAVESLSLAVPQGSLYGFIGPNGSGKTTTLRMIVNILRPDRGVLRVFDQPLLDPRSPRIGYLPEERGLYRRMKVRQFLRFYGELKAGRSVHDQVEAWIRRLDLEPFADRRIEALSKGTAQRVQFIAAVVADPDLVILDEPFSGLDPVNAEALRAALLAIRRRGATIILSTHDMAVAEQLCDFVCMIFRGRKVLDGTLGQIKSKYGSDTIRVRIENGMAALEGLEGAESVRDLGRCQEIRVRHGTDPQALLRALLDRARVYSFDVSEPSLHDIFVRIAGAPAEEGGPDA